MISTFTAVQLWVCIVNNFDLHSKIQIFTPAVKYDVEFVTRFAYYVSNLDNKGTLNHYNT